MKLQRLLLLIPNPSLQKKECLEKGQNGDWEKEGYVLGHSSNTGTSGKLQLNVDILHPSQIDKRGRHIEGSGKAGSAVFQHQDDGTLKPLLTHVDPEHQRKGIASALYAHAEKVTKKKILPSDSQSDDARRLWSQPNRPFGKSVHFLQNFKKSLLIKKSLGQSGLPSLQKAEDSKGMTMHDLGDGYTLHHSPVHLSADYQDRTSPILEHDDASKYVHSWAIKHGENTVGMVNVGAHKGHGMKNSKMRVSGSLISGEHQGKGLGRKAYAKLAEHYGGLESDIIRSDAATKAWASIPGVQKKVDENSGDNYRLPGNRKAPPVKFLKSLLKKSQNSNIVQVGPGNEWEVTKGISTGVAQPHVDSVAVQNAPSQPKTSLIDALRKIKSLLNYKDQMPGGKGDALKPTDFPAKDLAAGAKAEAEHTSNPILATEIAIDHMAEFAHYYDHLPRFEAKLKAETASKQK